MLFFFPRDVLGEILDLIESVPEGFHTYFCTHVRVIMEICMWLFDEGKIF